MGKEAMEKSTSRIKAKVIVSQAKDLGQQETRRSSHHKALHATCPGSQESCSLFFTLILTPARNCQGLNCTSQDDWPSPLQMDSPIQSPFPLDSLGTVLWQELLNHFLHRLCSQQRNSHFHGQQAPSGSPGWQQPLDRRNECF